MMKEDKTDKMNEHSLSTQVLLDASTLAMRLQSTLTFQLATALQAALGAFLDPEYTLACIVLLCIYTECAVRTLHIDVDIARRVLIAQLGQSVMRAIDDALAESLAPAYVSFLLRTCSLCLPSVIVSVSPVLVSNDYVQNAISAYVYQYAQGSEKMLQDIDWGAPPLYVCVLSIVLTRRMRSVNASEQTSKVHDKRNSEVLRYVWQAGRVLLVDVLIRSLWAGTVGAPRLVRASVSLSLVLAVDVLGLAQWGVLHDVRGYAVFKTAGQLNSLDLVQMDAGSALAMAVLLLCARSCAALVPTHVHSHVLVQAAHSVADVVCVASVSALLQGMATAGTLAAPGERFLWVCCVSVLAYRTQALLAAAGRSLIAPKH